MAGNPLGALLIDRGDWSAVVAYARGDVTSRGNRMYAALAYSLNDPPPSQNWQSLSGGPSVGLNLGWTSPPLLSNWTWVNQGTGTAADGSNPVSILMADPNGVGSHVRFLARTLPAAPYTLIAAIVPTLYGGSTGRVGIGLRQSGNDRHIALYLGMVGAAFEVLVSEYTDNATLFSNVVNTPIGVSYPVWLKIRDDATNLLFSVSGDGQFWIQIASIGRTAFLTADQCGLLVDCTTNNTQVGMQVVSWTGA